MSCFTGSLSLGYPTRYDTNLALPPQKMVRGFKFGGVIKKKNCTISYSV